MHISFPESHGRVALGIAFQSKYSVDEQELKKHGRCTSFEEKKSNVTLVKQREGRNGTQLGKRSYDRLGRQGAGRV